MEEWKEYKLGDVLNFRRGYDLPKTAMKEGDIPVAGSNGVIGYHNKATHISPCITIGRSGNVGTPFIYEKCWAHNTVLYIDDFKGNNPLYLFYLLKTLPLSSFGGGSAVPTLNRNHIHPLIIKHTSNLATQRRIANILKSLDDKIDCNRQINDNLSFLILVTSLLVLWILKRINDNLEKQIQALFKSWFVDFEPFKNGDFVESELGMIPKDWRVGKLGELCQFKRGKNLLSKDAVLGDVPVVAGGLEPSCYHNVSNTKSPVITVSGSGANAGFMRMYHQKVWASDCSYIDSTCECFLFIYCFLAANRKLLKHAQTGAVQPHVKPADIHDFNIIIPTPETIDRFQKTIMPSIKKKGKIEQESRRIAQLRDTLLPRLMSGELKV